MNINVLAIISLRKCSHTHTHTHTHKRFPNGSPSPPFVVGKTSRITRTASLIERVRDSHSRSPRNSRDSVPRIQQYRLQPRIRHLWLDLHRHRGVVRSAPVLPRANTAWTIYGFWAIYSLTVYSPSIIHATFNRASTRLFHRSPPVKHNYFEISVEPQVDWSICPLVHWFIGPLVHTLSSCAVCV